MCPIFKDEKVNFRNSGVVDLNERKDLVGRQGVGILRVNILYI